MDNEDIKTIFNYFACAMTWDIKLKILNDFLHSICLILHSFGSKYS